MFKHDDLGVVTVAVPVEDKHVMAPCVGGDTLIEFSDISELCIDKPGDTIVVDGVRGGGGGDATTTPLFAFWSLFPSPPVTARVC